MVLREESDDRVLYAVGTLPGHPLSGEESFLLERVADGGIWLTVRSFARAAGPGWALANPALGVARRRIAQRFLRALSAPIPGAGPLPSQRLAVEGAPSGSSPEPSPDEPVESRAAREVAATDDAPAIERGERDVDPQDS